MHVSYLQITHIHAPNSITEQITFTLAQHQRIGLATMV